MDLPHNNSPPLALAGSRMRRLLGGGGQRRSPAAKAEIVDGQQQAVDNTPSKKRRPFLAFLRNSFRHRPKLAAATADEPTANAAGHQQRQNGGGFLSPSRTFDAARSPQHLFSSSSAAGFCPSLSPAPSGCHSEPGRSGGGNATDGQLDRSLMQTCTEVKYENRRRPKFAAVVDANFQRQCLQAHNLVRQIYSCPPLYWSQELAELAKSWALKLAQRARMLYPELPGIGENIFLLTPEESSRHSAGDHLTTGTELVALWAAQARKLDFGRPRWSQEWSQFTQMIWRGSTEMGVARHWNTANDCLAIVAFYRPAGNCNLPGEFAANLPSQEEVPEDALEATSLQALSQALNRADLGDGGFRKGPLSPRHISCPPNTTKILKS